MGSEVVAKCRCGLIAGSMIGGGMSDFMTRCEFPCLCENCHDVVQVDLLARPTRCPKCGAADPIPYDDPRVIGTPGNGIVNSWNVEEQLGRELLLTNGTYKCPKCGKMTLRFARTGLCWD